MLSYFTNLWDSFMREKSFNTHLLQGYFSDLTEKIPTLCKGHGREDTNQPVFHQRDCLKIKSQVLDEDPFLPTSGWSGYITQVIWGKRYHAIKQMVTASTSMYSAEKEDCHSPFRICPFFGTLLLALRIKRNVLNSLKQNKIKFSP